MSYVLYHNPKCSKSRKAIEILDLNHIDYKVKLYLSEGLTVDEVKNLKDYLSMNIIEFIRQKEPEFKEANVDPSNESELIKLLVEHPKVLERPILLNQSRAVIGRPTENIIKFIGK